MGGKGKESSAAPVIQRNTQESDDNMAMYQAMLAAMMTSQQNAMAAMQQPPAPLQMPAIQETRKIDFSEQQAKLAAKAKADYGADQARRKRFADMVHTSYLLDEEEPTTTTVLT